MKQPAIRAPMFVVGFLLGAGVGIGVAAKAAGPKPTDVRVGPTAAIGIATSCDGKTVFVANGNGIFKSLDGGDSWAEVYR